MTLRTKLLLAQAPLLAALIFVGAVGSLTARELGRGAQAILTRELPQRARRAAHGRRAAAHRQRGAVLCRRRARDAGCGARRVAAQRSSSSSRVQEGNVTEPGEGEATARLRAAWQTLRRIARRIRAHTAERSEREAYFAELLPAVTAVEAAADSSSP